MSPPEALCADGVGQLHPVSELWYKIRVSFIKCSA